MDLAAGRGITSRVIELALLEAEVAANTTAAPGQGPRVWTALERALTAAKPEGYVRSFDQGQSLNRLLVEAARREIGQPYLNQILAAIGIQEDYRNLKRRRLRPSGRRSANMDWPKASPNASWRSCN